MNAVLDVFTAVADADDNVSTVSVGDPNSQFTLIVIVTNEISEERILFDFNGDSIAAVGALAVDRLMSAPEHPFQGTWFPELLAQEPNVSITTIKWSLSTVLTKDGMPFSE